MVEYIDQQIQHLSWQLADKPTSVISGSKNCVSVWEFIDSATNAFDQLPIVEKTRESVQDSVCRVYLIGKLAFTALSSNTVILHELETQPNGLKFLREISRSTPKGSSKPYKCNDMLFCAQTNFVITCTNNGSLGSFHIENPKSFQSKQICDSSLKCMDLINPNEVICGTLSGALKHFDLRTMDCVSTFENLNLSALTCVQRNPNVNHLAIGGNDQGSVLLYDLRVMNAALLQISAHSSAVTHLRYKPHDSYLLYSSSCDGELFSWNLNTEFTAYQTPRKVESISCVSDPLSISSFDVNQFGDLVYATDHGAIYYKKLDETRP